MQKSRNLIVTGKKVIDSSSTLTKIQEATMEEIDSNGQVVQGEIFACEAMHSMDAEF